ARRDIGMWAGEDREGLVAVEIGGLWVGARYVPLQAKRAIAALGEKRDLAGDEPGRPVRHEQAEIVPLDMRGQHLLARLGKGRGQEDRDALRGPDRGRSEEALKQKATDRRDAGDDKYPARAAIDPDEMPPLKRQPHKARAKTQRRPPQ